MHALQIMRELFGRGRKSAVETSRKMGRSDGYISRYVSGKVVPGVDVFAEILDTCGYDLLMRNRETGEETTIEPPEE